MRKTSQDVAREIQDELKKSEKNSSVNAPLLVKVALRYLCTGELPWWAKVAFKMKYGKFCTPYGLEYNGFKVEFKW